MANLLNACNISALWRGECAFDSPAVNINPLRNCGSANTCFSGPITERHCSSIQRKSSRARLISALFAWCFPFDIGGLIAKCIVNPSDRMFFAWSKTHVGKKVLKGIPAFANSNTNSTVSVVSLHGRVFTAANHGIPCSPFFGSIPANRVSVSFHNFSKSIMRSHYTMRFGFV